VHIPDGFINAPTAVGAGVAAAGGIGVSLRKTAQTLTERQAPLAGLVAAYIFAVQMLNFPVAAGTSGHLLGGLLAAVLVGPWAGAVCVAVVLVVQALFFADGGLTALGLNIVNMSLVTAWGGYAVFVLLRRALSKTQAGVVLSAGTAAGVSVVLASLAFVVEYAVGGTGSAPLGTVLAAMASVHTLIGIGEGIITALTVGLVLRVRPDLVYGTSDLQAPLGIRTQPDSAA
jgi:cobalt/nickel transport system permease protein